MDSIIGSGRLPVTSNFCAVVLVMKPALMSARARAAERFALTAQVYDISGDQRSVSTNRHHRCSVGFTSSAPQHHGPAVVGASVQTHLTWTVTSAVGSVMSKVCGISCAPENASFMPP